MTLFSQEKSYRIGATKSALAVILALMPTFSFAAATPDANAGLASSSTLSPAEVAATNAAALPGATPSSIAAAAASAIATPNTLSAIFAAAGKAANESGATPKSIAAAAVTAAAAANTAPAANTPNPGGETIAGVSFGVAIGATLYPQKNVTTAAVQNGVVAVTNSDTKSLGVWGELHYFWGLGPHSLDPSTSEKCLPSDPLDCGRRFGMGPFIAVQAGSGANSNVIQALGGGIMVGGRRTSSSTNSINVGIGYGFSQINTLAGGITEGRALPTGVTAVTTKTKLVGAPFIITSFSF
jgi:hypothetical protein